MAATTTLKLPQSLKERIAPLAASCGKTAHAWMVETLEAETERAEKRGALYAEARAGRAEVEAKGKVFRSEDVHRLLRARLSGRSARRPRPVKA